MKLILDTSALSKVFNEDTSTIRLMSSPKYDSYLLPLAAEAEILRGFLYGKKVEENLLKYDDIISRYPIELIEPNKDTAFIYAELATWCKRNGKLLSHNDLWIAAATIQVGGVLLTFDIDFKCLMQLRTIIM
jgi:predicted nucleic acid-binding protein